MKKTSQISLPNRIFPTQNDASFLSSSSGDNFRCWRQTLNMVVFHNKVKMRIEESLIYIPNSRCLPCFKIAQEIGSWLERKVCNKLEIDTWIRDAL
ncbi:hypothetical protein Q3G72_004437 [Acer saccharum]|nr:hypothetical protein Q3G72_004437 [Acer saccharum]